MSKNSRLTGAGGNIFAADNITVGDNEVYYQKVKIVLGADGSDEGTLSSTDGIPLKTAGAAPSITITRPADTTAYTAGDVVGNATSAILEITSVGNAGEELFITDIVHIIAAAAVPVGMAGFKLHFYNDTPAAIADNSPFALGSADRTKYVNQVQLSTPALKAGTVLSIDSQLNQSVTLSSTGSLIFQMETDGAFTPVSGQVEYITIHAVKV